KDEAGRKRLEDIIEKTAEKTKPFFEAQRKLSELLEKLDGSVSEDAIAAARNQVLTERKNLHADENFKGLKLSFAAERETLPPGEHVVTGPDSGRVKVRVDEGSSVSMRHVDAVLARSLENGIKPDELVFSLKSSALGSASKDGTVMIRTRGEDTHFLATFDHESGHLAEFKINPNSPANLKLTEIWKESVKDAGNALHDKAGKMGDKLPPGGVDGLVKEIIDSPVVSGTSGTDKYAKYYASRSELIAEMFALYRHEQRLVASGKEAPSYKDLVRDVVGPKDGSRADVMQHFGKMYEHLRSTMFNDFSNQNAARDRFMAAQTPQDTQGLRTAFGEHGGGSKEFRTAFEDLSKTNTQRAREALVDSIFAREQGLDPASFDPSKLGLEQARKYRMYQQFTKDNYDPTRDSSVPIFSKPSVEKAFRAYKESLPAVEAMAAKRTDGAIKDITRTHLNDFMSKHAPGLKDDVTDAWYMGRDRLDPLGELDGKYESLRAHRMSQDEVVSDLFKAYLHKESMTASGKPSESFENILRQSVGEERAQELKNFTELWKKLDRDVFPAFKRMPSDVVA
ncbi:MAG: hypothetical protein K2Z81_19585, partial [Cyanobacteria bacterium]|nr:hypothetical protein [Cyanobacteriota bacterium]